MPPAALLLLSFLLLSPCRLFADAPATDPQASSAQEEMAPDIFPVISDNHSIQNKELPFVVAQQKGSGQEEPSQRGSGRESNPPAEEKEEEKKEEIVQIADPLRPWNKAMYYFNDKLYFWALKPATLGYSYIVPEPARITLNNFFDNLKAPGRFVNNLFQLKMKAAGNEFVRFIFNSTAGLGGLADAAKEILHIRKSPADFGQTLGYYGIGHGFYLVLPIIGPSSLRDSAGYLGDRILYPLSYFSFTNISFGVSSVIFVVETTNETSFRIGEYETFKEAAIDPYISMRDGYFQNRKKAVEK
jgi:phospholipid-binding lipoprotein MlaA